MNKLKSIHREYQKLNLLLINILEKKNFPTQKNNWEKSELNNKSIALNILCIS